MTGRRSNLLIYVDHRERGNDVVKKLATYRDVLVEVRHLAVADYILGEQTAVERKTAADLAQSILDRRLFDQVEQLVAAFEQPLLIVEGQELYVRPGIHPNAIRGALSYVVALKRVPILRTVDAEDTAAYLRVIARHAQQGLGYEISLHHKRKALGRAQQQRYVLESLPGIGPSLARALLNHFGSLAQVLAADKEALGKVPGVGETIASKIIEIATGSYEDLGNRSEKGTSL